MWDHKESWALKNWCFWISFLDCKVIQPVSPKGYQSWIFIGRTEAEAETSILWPPDTKSWLVWKDPDSGKNWRQEEKGMTEDEMVGWHHWLNGHEFEQTLEVGDGQGGLACCSPRGHRELDITEWLNNNNKGGKLTHLQNPRKAQELQVLRCIWRQKQKTGQMEQKTKEWVQKALSAV